MRHEQIESMRKMRKFRPLFLIDIAVPRDIEASVGEIDGVYLYDIDTLQQIAGQARERRREQVNVVRADHRGGSEGMGFVKGRRGEGGNSRGRSGSARGAVRWPWRRRR
jgi:hypothetical protein